MTNFVWLLAVYEELINQKSEKKPGNEVADMVYMVLTDAKFLARVKKCIVHILCEKDFCKVINSTELLKFLREIPINKSIISQHLLGILHMCPKKLDMKFTFFYGYRISNIGVFS